VCKISIDGGEPEKLSREFPRSWGTGPSISPDGTRIAYAASGGIEFIPFEGGDVSGPQPPYTADEWNVHRWTPDGGSMAHVYWDAGVSNLHTRPVGGGASVQRTFLDHPDGIGSFAWSPDGTQVVLMTGGYTGQVVLLEGF
jgi:Tol biopolymer transport system component